MSKCVNRWHVSLLSQCEYRGRSFTFPTNILPIFSFLSLSSSYTSHTSLSLSFSIVFFFLSVHFLVSLPFPSIFFFLPAQVFLLLLSPGPFSSTHATSIFTLVSFLLPFLFCIFFSISLLLFSLISQLEQQQFYLVTLYFCDGVCCLHLPHTSVC